MDNNTKIFLLELNITNHVSLLLELYGVAFLDDLTSFDDSDIENIERNVRQGEFSNQVDFDSKQNRIKYLGFDLANWKDFTFRPIDKKKLSKIGAAASKKLESLKIKSAKSKLVKK